VVTSRSNASANNRTGRGRFLIVLCAIGLLLAGAGHASAAKKRVAVLDFTGPKAAKFQASVLKILKKTATVVSQKAFTKAAKKVKGFSMDAEGVAKVSRRLELAGVVSGKVVKKKGKYKLTIKVREGQEGEFLEESLTVSARAPRLTKAQEKKVARELKAFLRELPDPEDAEEGGEAEEEEGDRPVVAGAEEDVGEEEAAPRKGGKALKETSKRTAAASEGGDEEGVGGGEDTGGEEEGGAEEGGGEEPGGSGGEVSKGASVTTANQADLDARGRAVDVAAGLSFSQRTLTFTYDSNLVNTPQGYDGTLVPGFYVTGEIYPMALVNRKDNGFTRHIGLSLVLDKVLLIKSKPAGMDDVDLPTAQTRYGAGLVYRLNFGSKPTSPTLKVSARYNKLSFSIDESGAPEGVVIDIPDTSYTYIDPGVGIRFPVTEQIAALGEARFLFVTKAGQIQQDMQYGTTTITGFDVDLGGEYKLTSNLLVRAGLRYTTLSLKFDGSGELTDRNGDGTQDVKSAKDRYLGIYAAGGWLF
jgi:hypothetical protein